MSEPSFAKKRANRRIPFFAAAEITLLDGTSVRAQLAELSVNGCYLGSLIPVPVKTELLLRISDGMRSCELNGKVIYVHSSDGLGIFGVGILFVDVAAEQRSVIEAWLHRIAKQVATPEVP
jgi:hypothetical protein